MLPKRNRGEEIDGDWFNVGGVFDCERKKDIRDKGKDGKGF